MYADAKKSSFYPQSRLVEFKDGNDIKLNMILGVCMENRLDMRKTEFIVFRH